MFVCAGVALGQAGPAAAAPARVRFQIPPKPLAEALLDLAQQANITLIGAAACEGVSRTGLSGTMPVDEALDELLAHAPCSWRTIAPATIQIGAKARAPAEPIQPAVVSELLVTATKRVSDPRQLAVAVTAVRGEDLLATGSRDASESAAQLGLLATNLGLGRDKLLLRGLSDGAYTGRARSTVATYLDDIPLNYNAPDPDLRLVDVERVEIARGPQGALYGAGVMSGVYRIVPNRPDLQRYSGEARITGAITEHGQPSSAFEGYVNAPLFSDTLGVRLAAYDELQGGYLDDINLRRHDANHTERRGGRLTVLLRPSADWAVDLMVTGQRLRAADTQYTAPGLGLNRNNRILEPHANDLALAKLRIQRSWGWGDLTATTGYIQHSYGSFYDATPVQILYTRFAETSAYSERTHTKMLVEDAFLTSRGAGRLQWLFGVYGASAREHSPTEFLAQHSFAPDVEVYGDNRRDWIDELAAYGEATYRLGGGWTAGLGGRLFTLQYRTTSEVVSENFAPHSVDRSQTFNGFSPKISLQKELAPGRLAYVLYSEGYRAGGMNSGGAVPLSPALESYSPDRLRNYEAGFKLTNQSRSLTLNSAVFYDIWKDIQTDQYRPSGIPFTTNAGDATILGLEGELGYQLDDALSIQLNGRVGRTRNTNLNPFFTPTFVRGLPGAPPVSGGAVVSYVRPFEGDWRLSLVGELTYVGRSRVTFDTTFPEMGGYLRSKLLMELRRRNLGMQVFVTNPTNAFSDTFAFGNPFNPNQTPQVTPQRPRTLGVTLFATY